MSFKKNYVLILFVKKMVFFFNYFILNILSTSFLFLNRYQMVIRFQCLRNSYDLLSRFKMSNARDNSDSAGFIHNHIHIYSPHVFILQCFFYHYRRYFSTFAVVRMIKNAFGLEIAVCRSCAVQTFGRMYMFGGRGQKEKNERNCILF